MRFQCAIQTAIPQHPECDNLELIQAQTGPARLPESQPSPMFRLSRMQRVLCALWFWYFVLGIASGGAESTESQGLSPQVVQEIERNLKEGEFEEALRQAEKQVGLDANNALAHTYLGMAALHLNLPDRAITAFERSIAINPQDPRAHLNLALLYASKNDLSRAIASYETGLRLEPQNSSALFNYGKLLMHERRFPEAAEALTRVLRLEPQDTEARIVLVEAHLNVGQQLQAREEVGRILESKQTPVSLLPKLAASLIRGNELTSARAVLNKALSLSPSMAEAYFELSKLHAASGQDDEAVHSAKHGVELAPGSLEAHLTLAEALIGSRRYLEALNSLSQVETRFQNSAAFHYTRGIAEMGLHRHPSAIAALEKAVELDPNYDRAQFLLATAYYTTGDFERAEVKYKAAIALNNTNALYFSHLAGVYDRRGPDFEQAAREATFQALALNPDDPECNQRLAKWAIGREDFLKARAILEKVVSQNPKLIPPRALLIHVYNRLTLKAAAQEQQRMIQSIEEEVRKQRSGSLSPPPAGEENRRTEE